ncbi:uncharacterized protein LOC123682974 [Harmonia axyridis]|uniref:uncharacterized protein LOC123682974 n=1 Tax=Harmonia axyridis TaxID=115357 RepID=UPI001E275BB2|nr:uncharacterized protein LOC123682974 [Harmonia axyridis]
MSPKMNIILVVCTLIVAISAIRVPTVWPDDNSQPKHLKSIGHGHYHSKLSVNNREHFRIHPQKSRIRKNFHVHKKPYRVSKLPTRVQHFHSKPKKFFRKHKPRASPWMPIAPFSKNTNLFYTPPKAQAPLDLKQHPQTYYRPASSEYVTSRSSPLYKNYRDDRTYEHEDTEDERITEPSPDVERPSIKESDQEQPMDIPTAPIYPGDGQWAKPGQKHKPFISKQKYSELMQDSEEKPDGFEIFERGQKLYDNKQAKFVDTRRKIYPETETNDEQQNEKQQEKSDSSEEEDGFVPSTMYVQVRRSENEEHLPSDSEDAENGRLKEVIKDSKILTVYTEEGYEDSAYDHAGHEKEAEDSQGYKEYNKEEEKTLDPKKGSLKNHKTTVDDQNEDGSSNVYKHVEKPNKSKRKKYIPKNKNKLFKTESMKTMKLKEEPDGTQMEITSEVKTMTNPGNDEKIVQVLPKVIKYSNHSNQTSQKELDKTIQELSSTPANTRKKRFANDFPQIDVKTDFINGVIGNDNSNYNTIKEKEKYPYYNSKYINPNSPLKYSENMDNIPIKKEGEMTFYEQTNEVQCPEVDEDIEAIPRRIQDVEESLNNGEKLEDSEEAGKSPRLGKLGQRIDCFKRKYFGENPLDSPFFKEKEIEYVPPLFKVLQERSAGFQAHHGKTKEALNNNYRKKYHSKFSVRGRKQPSFDREKQNSVNDNEELDSEEIVNDVRVHKQLPENESNNLRQSFEDITPEVEVINVDTFKSINHVTTESPSVSLITTPNYSINITPKHIYDQIKLLDFLPSVTTATILSLTDQPRQGKLVEEVTESAKLQMRPKYHIYNQRRPLRRKNKRPQFDVESFIQDSSRRVTITPNSYKTEENSAYEQTPLDQMNVFADVFNNIRNGSNDPLRIGASILHKPNDFNLLQKPVVRMRVPPKKIHIKVPDSVELSNDRKLYHNTTTLPTTRTPPTTKSKRGSIRYALTTEKEVNYDDYDTEDDSQYSNEDKSIRTSTSGFVEDEGLVGDEDSEASGTHTTETIRKPPVKKMVDIVGLVPPSKYHYRTIYQPIEELHEEPIVSESEVINNYHVLGMKPPSTKQKVYDYSDFQRLLSLKNHKYRNHRRGKRSPNRKSYFEVVQRQNSPEVEAEQQEDDDYVPHRPKNWHWDEKLKKIVYDKPIEERQPTKSRTEEEEEEEEEEEIVEIEVEDTPSRNIQQTTTRRSFTSTTPINGPSYVDFVKLLKSKKDYISIPDPTTTKDGLKMESTTLSTTTIKSEPTKPPEFLSFVSKLRQSDSYKVIEEKNKTKTTTTEAPIDEEEEEEDTDTALSNIQNSPGRGAVDIGQNFKIFDVNDFLPKVKTYSPRTEIDYSKYKTIQRPRPQTTPQPDEDEKEEVVNIEKPHTAFLIEESEEKHTEPATEGKVEIFEVSRPTTSSTTSATTVKIQKTRRRRPTTTQRTIAPSATNTKEAVVHPVHPKPKRVYPRRRPTHIRSRTTTPKTEEDAETEESHKVVIRSHNPIERNPKIISLEAIIQMDQPKKSNEQIPSKRMTPHNKTREITVDDILKNINRLKEVSVEEVVPDYSLDAKNDEEDADSKDEYFEDDNTKIGFDDGSTTDRKLVISKNKQQGMFYYTSVR